MQGTKETRDLLGAVGHLYDGEAHAFLPAVAGRGKGKASNCRLQVRSGAELTFETIFRVRCACCWLAGWLAGGKQLQGRLWPALRPAACSRLALTSYRQSTPHTATRRPAPPTHPTHPPPPAAPQGRGARRPGRL